MVGSAPLPPYARSCHGLVIDSVPPSEYGNTTSYPLENHLSPEKDYKNTDAILQIHYDSVCNRKVITFLQVACSQLYRH